jgi:hypothetical protein
MIQTPDQLLRRLGSGRDTAFEGVGVTTSTDPSQYTEGNIMKQEGSEVHWRRERGREREREGEIDSLYKSRAEIPRRIIQHRLLSSLNVQCGENPSDGVPDGSEGHETTRADTTEQNMSNE